MKAIFTLILTFTTILTLASCNTVAGVGQDLQDGGRIIKDVAK